jgi:hypothetical protein
MLTRRSLFLLTGAGAAGLREMAAGSSEFWDKKPPSEWTNVEIDRLLTKSPWAKDASTQYAPGQASGRGGYPDGGYPDSTGYPGGGGGQRGGGIGGLSIPGIGGIGFPRGGGGGGGRGPGGQPRGGQSTAFHGTVRWDSAHPILDAVKTPLPEAFDGRYVIAVSGIPLLNDTYQGTRGEDEDAPARRSQNDSLDNLKSLTSLQVKGKDYVQAGVVQRQIGTGNTILFGFSKEMLSIDKRDSEALFATQLGRIHVKAHFSPKEMLYHGELAV